MLALMCASSFTSASATQAPAATSSNIDGAIRAVADAYVKATLAADAKAIADLYTDDAIEMPPNQPLVKGRAAIAEHHPGNWRGARRFGQIHRHSETHGRTLESGVRDLQQRSPDAGRLCAVSGPSAFDGANVMWCARINANDRAPSRPGRAAAPLCP
jgi:hypothetical protein